MIEVLENKILKKTRLRAYSEHVITFDSIKDKTKLLPW